MNTTYERLANVWHVREVDDNGASRAYTLTCEIRVPTVGPERSYHTCGKPAHWRAITGAGDLSGQNYDERFCCGDCKAADEESGREVVDGVLVADYGPLYEYEEITKEWLDGT